MSRLRNFAFPPAHVLGQIGIIIFAGWYVYSPVFYGAKLWDDDVELPRGRLPFDLHGLSQIWAGKFGADYYPLKTTVQWIQGALWGNTPLGFHLTNIGLHLLSAFLLWWLFNKLKIPNGWLGGLLFAVHPVAVESVAWLSELKNVLSLPPLLLAFAAYIDYDERREPTQYAWVLFWFIVSLLCKSSTVMFPLTLLLYGWWQHGRIRWQELRSTAVLFGLSLVFGLLEVNYQSRAIGGEMVQLGGLLSRLTVAGLAGAFYLFKCLVPVRLLPIYPRWAAATPTAMQLLPWIAGAMLAGWLWLKRAGFGRHLLFGLGFFFVNLIPVLGLVAMSYHRISWVADHFSYLPLVGLVGIGVAALPKRENIAPPIQLATSLAITAVVVALASTAHRYARNFRNSEALWTYTLQHNSEAWAAHNNLGMELAKSGRWPESLAQYRETLSLKPDYAEAHHNLGLVLAELGRWPEALAQDREALRLKPDYAEAQSALGTALAATDQWPEAMIHFREALRVNPNIARIHNNLALALEHAGQSKEAIFHFTEALRLVPDMSDAESNLGNLLAREGRFQEAIGHLERSLRRNPNSAETHNSLGNVLTKAGRFAEALAQYKEALRLSPNFSDAHMNLGLILGAQHQPSEAVREYEVGLRQRPDYVDALLQRAETLAASGQFAEAELPLKAILALHPDNAKAKKELGEIERR